MGFHTTVTLRHFRSRKGFVSLVSGFSLMGIMLGVGALIVVMSVMEGFRTELLSRMLGVTGHVTVSSSGFERENLPEIEEKISKLDGVKHVLPYVQGQGLLMSGAQASGVLARGVNPKENFLTQGGVVSGNAEDLAKKRRIVIGDELAKSLGVGVGSVLTLVAPQGAVTVAGFIPRMQTFKVAAIFDVGLQAYDGAWVFLNMEDAATFYGLDKGISGIQIQLTKADDATALSSKIKELFDFYVFTSTWQTVNAEFFEALKVERTAMFIILSLIILIAAFNIITGQTMLVNDKRSDIAILRTMGARRRDILNIFFLSGMLIGVIGTTLGVVGGVVIVMNLEPIVTFLENVFHVSLFSGGAYFLDELPSQLVWEDVGAIAALSLALTMVSSLFPAWKAAKLDPVEALRYE